MKGVDEYQDPVDTNSLSVNFAAVLPEVKSLLNHRVERTVITNEITQDNNKVLEYESNETFKLHRMESSMEEAVSTLHSLVKADQRNGVPQKKSPL